MTNTKNAGLDELFNFDVCDFLAEIIWSFKMWCKVFYIQILICSNFDT